MKVVFVNENGKEINPFETELSADEVAVLLKAKYVYAPTSSEGSRSFSHVEIVETVFHAHDKKPQLLQVIVKDVDKSDKTFQMI